MKAPMPTRARWTPGVGAGPIATRIDRALRARFRDETLKYRVIQYLVARTKAPHHWEEIELAARLIDPLLEQARKIAERYEVEGNVAYVEADRMRPTTRPNFCYWVSSVRPWRWCGIRDRWPLRLTSNPGWT